MKYAWVAILICGLCIAGCMRSHVWWVDRTLHPVKGGKIQYSQGYRAEAGVIVSKFCGQKQQVKLVNKTRDHYYIYAKFICMEYVKK